MGQADENGEYAVVNYDDQPEVWITNGSIIQYILDNSQVEFDFTTDLDKARERNKHLINQEWWHEDFKFPE